MEEDDTFLSDASHILLSSVNVLSQDLQEKTREINRVVFLRSNALDNSNLILDLKKNNLRKIIETLVEIYQKSFSFLNKCIYEIHYMSMIEDFVFDKEKIYLVIDNLLSNATKFTNKGMILIEVENNFKDNLIFISVKDSGTGMKPEEFQNIFQLGFKGKDSYGNGVGLFFVNKIILEHNGYIKVKTKFGEGSEFKIILRTDLEEN